MRRYGLVEDGDMSSTRYHKHFEAVESLIEFKLGYEVAVQLLLMSGFV